VRKSSGRKNDDWFARGEALEARGDFAAAEAVYRSAAADGRCSDGTADFLLGRMLHERLGRAAEAEVALRRAIESGRVDAGADLGILMQTQGRIQEAEAAYRMTVDAGWPPGWGFLANVLSKQPGREDEAEAACWNAIENGSFDAWISLGDTLAQVPGREVDAENAFYHAINAGKTAGWTGVGLLLARQPGREADAEQAIRQPGGSGPRRHQACRRRLRRGGRARGVLSPSGCRRRPVRMV